MKVKELIERLSEMPQDLDVRMIVYEHCPFDVRNCKIAERRRGIKTVEIDNYVE